MPDRYALIIANGTYRDPKLSRLRTPTRDAEELARVLRDPEIGDFAVELSVDEPEHALRRRIAGFFAGRARDDLLLLHFSCHGLKDDSGQLYFAATDTEVAHLDATALSAEFVSRQITRSRSRKVVALLDCCYSGAIARGLRFRAGEEIHLDDHLGGHGRVILTASSAMEYAFEGDEVTGTPAPSVFTSAVVKGLETGHADRDQDHRISVDELYDYVCEQVREVTPDQTPNMLSHLEGELYIARSSYVAAVDPTELPVELRAAIESPFAGVREGAVSELARLAAASDPGLAAAARVALGDLERDDSRSVAAAASAALRGVEPPPLMEPSPRRVAAPPAAPAPAANAPQPPIASVGEGPAPRSRRRTSAHTAFVPLALAALGALLVLVGLDGDAAGLVTIETLSVAGRSAAVLAVGVIAIRRVRADVRLDATAAALAAVPLGVALTANKIHSYTSEAFGPVGLAALGALLVGAAALWEARAWAPRGRSHLILDAVVLSAAAAVVVGSVGIWAEGERPAGMMQLALLAGAAIAAASAIGGALRDRAPRWTDLLALAAPAAGVLGVASTLTIAEWIATRGNATDDGLALTFWASIALTVAAVASLAFRARRRSTTSRAYDPSATASSR